MKKYAQGGSGVLALSQFVTMCNDLGVDVDEEEPLEFSRLLHSDFVDAIRREIKILDREIKILKSEMNQQASQKGQSDMNRDKAKKELEVKLAGKKAELHDSKFTKEVLDQVGYRDPRVRAL